MVVEQLAALIVLGIPLLNERFFRSTSDSKNCEGGTFDGGQEEADNSYTRGTQSDNRMTIVETFLPLIEQKMKKNLRRARRKKPCGLMFITDKDLDIP